MAIWVFLMLCKHYFDWKFRNCSHRHNFKSTVLMSSMTEVEILVWYFVLFYCVRIHYESQFSLVDKGLYHPITWGISTLVKAIITFNKLTNFIENEQFRTINEYLILSKNMISVIWIITIHWLVWTIRKLKLTVNSEKVLL